MPEELKDAQTEGEEEVQEVPTPELSAGSATAGSEEPRFDEDALVQKLVEKLVPQVDEAVDRRFKSGKDVRFNKVDEIYEWVKAAGGDPSKIKGALEQSDTLSRIEKLEAAINQGGAGGAAPADDELEQRTAEILEEAGIPFDDPVIAELAKKHYASKESWYHTVNKEVAKRAKQGNVTSATTVGVPGKPAAAGAEEEALLNELNDMYAGKQGSLSLPENQARIKEITAKLNEISPPDSSALPDL